MSERLTLLLVSYHFAPGAAVGGRRFSFLSREFSRLGYEVHTVAAPLRETYHGSGAGDSSLPVSGTVHRCAETVALPVKGRGLRARAINAVCRRVLAPVGWEYFWSAPAVREGLNAVRGARQGVVIATVPPAAAAIAGARLARRLGWPLILDYRDPWSAYPWPAKRMSPVAGWLARRLEAACVRQSAARVLNTAAMRQWFQQYFPAAAGERNFVISNGFDPSPDPPSPDPASTLDEGPVRIVYAGSLYTERSLVPVLQAASNLHRSGVLPRGVKLVQYGDLPARERTRVREAGLEAYLDCRSRIAWRELLPELRRAHALLVISGDDVTYAIPYKAYDYLAAARPMLALTSPDTALRMFVEDSGAGVCAAPNDVPGIEAALRRLLCGAPQRGAAEATGQYQWSRLAGRYREVIDTVLEQDVALPGAPSRAWQLQE